MRVYTGDGANPDVLGAATYDEVGITQLLKDLDINPKMFGAIGLIPIARQYPGAREFVESYRKEFPGASLSYQSAQGYGGCQVFIEAAKRAGSLDREKFRDAILKLDFNTAFGAFKIDPDGFQIAHKNVLFQWQDGKKVIVWPEELAPGKLRFPTPPWSQR